MEARIGAKWAALAGAVALCMTVALLSAADPVLRVKSVSTNQIEISVTNAAGGEVYGLYHRPFVQPPYLWMLHTVGT